MIEIKPSKNKKHLHYQCIDNLEQKSQIRVLKSNELINSIKSLQLKESINHRYDNDSISTDTNNNMMMMADEKMTDDLKENNYMNNIINGNDNGNSSSNSNDGGCNGPYSSNNIYNNTLKSLKIELKNEKKYKDLNKSLANLASRRLTGRSSSDNDHNLVVSPTNENHHHPIDDPDICTTNAKGNHQDLQVQQSLQGQQEHQQSTLSNLISVTPYNPIKVHKVFQTSVQNYFDNTPSTYYEGRRINPYNYLEGEQHRDLTLSNLYYDKFQKVPKVTAINKSIMNNPAHRIKNSTCNSNNTEGTPITSKPRYHRDFLQYFTDKPQYTNNASHYTSLDSQIGRSNSKDMAIRSVYSRGGYGSGEEMKDGLIIKNNEDEEGCERNLVENIEDNKKNGLDEKAILKQNLIMDDLVRNGRKKDRISMGNAQQSNFTPAFKLHQQQHQQTNYIYTLQNHIEKHTKTYLDNNIKKKIPNDSNTINMENSRISDPDSQGRIDFDNINDGVEYTKGGVGINSSKKLARGEFFKLRVDTEEGDNNNTNDKTNDKVSQKITTNHKENKVTMHAVNSYEKSNQKGRKASQDKDKDKVQDLKQDILNIKKDMEKRKQCYKEVNQFVRMHEKGLIANQNSLNLSEKGVKDCTNNQVLQRNSSASLIKQRESDIVGRNSRKNTNSQLTTATTPRNNKRYVSVSHTKSGKYTMSNNSEFQKDQIPLQRLYKTEANEWDQGKYYNTKEDLDRQKFETPLREGFYDFNMGIGYDPINNNGNNFAYDPLSNLRTEQSPNYFIKKQSCCTYEHDVCNVF